MTTHLTRAEAQALARATLADMFPGRDWGLGCLKNLDQPLRAQVFCAAHPDRHLVAKVYAPAEAARAAAQAARQAKLGRALAAGPWRVPQVLGFDADRRVLVMDYAPGATLAALWPGLDPDAKAALMTRAGGWLAALHGLSRRQGKLRPARQIGWLARRLTEARDGLRPFPEIAEFAQALAQLEALVPELRGLPVPRAVTHRDLHLSNLVVSDGALWGLDVENAAEDDPARDLVALLIDAVALGGDIAPMAAALASGYDDRDTPAELRLFLQRAYALGLWCRTPAQPSQRQALKLAAARLIIRSDAPLI